MPQRHPVASLDSFPPGSKRAFNVAERRVALFNVEGKLHAMDDVCPHAGASLAAGPLKACVVTCPLHAIRFDVATGQPVGLKGIDALQCFPVVVTDGRIEIEV